MKKHILTSLFTLAVSAAVYALPGFKPYIPDNSGDYVYYRDTSFERESYIGILRYDEGTYQLRYYAPENKADFQAEKSIALLLTLDPDADYVNLTGERILSAILPNTEDTDLVNYLHDILYEFTARRGKIYDEISPENEKYISNKGFQNNGISFHADFPQFGGDVSMTYDYLIPLFNLKSITDMENNKILSCVTFGTLTSSEDTSFQDFKGFHKAEASGRKLAKTSKHPQKINYKLDEKEIILDSDWKQSMENLWLLGDAALFSVTSIPESTTNDSVLYENYILRRLIASGQDSFADIENISLVNDKNGGFTITSRVYQPKTDNHMISIKSVTKQKSGPSTFLLFTAFEEEYAARKKYFDKLISENR